MKKYRNGLIVGKFAPLHKGHELLIEYGLRECEKLFIFSYSKPEFAGYEPPRREHWLKLRFPNAEIFVFKAEDVQKRFGFDLPANDANDVTHRRFVGRLWLELVNEPLDVVFTSENYGDGFAAELTEYFAERADFPIVNHVCVDLERLQIPISGSQMRGDVHGLKHFLASEIYASFVKRICFLGGESSGKSTLAEAAANEYKTIFVAEYGRTLWEEQSGNLTFEDLLKIARRHIQNEDAAAAQADKFLFVDTSPLTTLFYSLQLFGAADPELVRLSYREYDCVFLCAPDFPFVQDGTRVGAEFRNLQHRWYLETLGERQISFEILSGDLTARLLQIKNSLKGF